MGTKSTTTPINSILRSVRIGGLVGILLICMNGVASADPLGVGNAGAIFRLVERASFQEGCFAPCMCPVMVEQPMLGTFRLAYAGASGVDVYQVTGVNFEVPGHEAASRISGTGKYSIGSPDAALMIQQRMELDLRVDDSPPAHFDSGWVSRPQDGGIFIPVSIHGMYCWDRVITIDARMVPAAQLTPYRLGAGATYQFGCFGPCDCAIHTERPMRGCILFSVGSGGNCESEHDQTAHPHRQVRIGGHPRGRN